MTPDDFKDADNDLMNWGRSMRDSWLEHNLLIDPPPTSSGYLAPLVAYDDPEPVKSPIDEISAKVTEHVIISIGVEPEGFEHYVALVAWYTRLVFLECPQAERYKRLAKKIHCSYDASPVILMTAQVSYAARKRVLDGLMKMCRKAVAH